MSVSNTANKSLQDAAINFIRELLQACFVTLDGGFVLDRFSSEAIWIGPGETVFCRTIPQNFQSIFSQIQRERIPCEITDGYYHAQVFCSETCMVSGWAELRRAGQPPHRLYLSALCEMQEGQFVLHQMHLSNPQEQRYGQLKGNIEDTQGFALLANHVPGGMYRCAFDAGFTLIQINESLLEMIGYTREELRSNYQNSLNLLIDPQDRVRVAGEITRQIAASGEIELEYRMRRQDGSFFWAMERGRLVRDEHGEPSLCCILLDCTKEKTAQEELNLSLERHQIIMDQTNDIIFEWDVARDRLIYSPNWVKKFGYQPIRERATQHIMENSRLHPDDREIFRACMHEICAGKGYTEAEIRIGKADGSYLWCRVRVTAQFNSGGIPVKAVGVIIDIDAEKRRSRKLQEQAERDALTGLYNRGTTQMLIEQRLAKAERGSKDALFIMDVDNFKQVNDSMGHLFGDAFLVEVASSIQKLFRTTDVVGRIGGDEFLAFMPNIPNEQVAEDKAERVIHTFNQLFREEQERLKFSCSIGIAFAPSQGNSFNELYQKADQALYRAKSGGKGQHCVYNPAWEFIPSPESVINERIESDREILPSDSRLEEKIFRILYQTSGENSVGAILELVGRRLDVSRAYIFENSEDGRCFENTFLWSAEESEEDDMERYAYLEDLDVGYLEHFKDRGIFLCNNTQFLPEKQREFIERQGTHSLIQCAFHENGEPRGFVGFDECRRERIWTREQIDTLSLISEILGTFLIKKRTEQRLCHAAVEISSVLDNQRSNIYVVDRKTYEMLYMNQQTCHFNPKARLGKPCYETMFGKQKPCESCPLAKLNDRRRSYKMDVAHPEIGVWWELDASWTIWQGREACIVNCHDVSRYYRDK